MFFRSSVLPPDNPSNLVSHQLYKDIYVKEVSSFTLENIQFIKYDRESKIFGSNSKIQSATLGKSDAISRKKVESNSRRNQSFDGGKRWSNK